MAAGSQALEEPGERRVERVAMLTLVLGYDDLLVDVTKRFVLEGRPTAITMGRAADEAPASFRSEGELRFPDRFEIGDAHRFAALIR